jgi:hypothetical protein
MQHDFLISWRCWHIGASNCSLLGGRRRTACSARCRDCWIDRACST